MSGVWAEDDDSRGRDMVKDPKGYFAAARIREEREVTAGEPRGRHAPKPAVLGPGIVEMSLRGSDADVDALVAKIRAEGIRVRLGGAAIEWDGVEKFYYSEEWMRYVIDTFLRPEATLQSELANPIEGRTYAAEFEDFTFDHVVNGKIAAQGEDRDDNWFLVVKDNNVDKRDA